MINFEQAKIIALSKLKEIENEAKTRLAFLENDTLSFDYGWVFFYQSEEFVKTGDTQNMVGGNAPILIDKYDGNIYLTGTRKDIKDYIKIYSEFKRTWLS